MIPLRLFASYAGFAALAAGVNLGTQRLLLGASEYLSKPVDRSRLIDVLFRFDGAAHNSVLVVDDDADSRRILSNAVRAEGFSVQEAENGKVALEHVLERRPSLIFLDLLMPEMDGYVFIEKLRALPREKGGEVPVIALTAYTGSSEQSRVLSSGFQMYLPKPVNSNELLSALINLTKQSSKL